MIHRFNSCIGLAWLGLMLSGWVASAAPTASLQWELTPLTTNEVRQVFRPAPKTRAVVFQFLGTECPIANRVLPELDRLAREYQSQGIQFVAVYSNFTETAEGVRQQRAEAGVSGAAGLDPNQALADQLGVTVTPELVVLTPDGKLIYRGRVNDQYAGLGQGKPAPQRHDLAEALAEFVKSGQPAGIQTKPAGCRIQRRP
ncbi:MAG: redoxin family protein [Verrucomicrobia bacterium]|nr:redoxin family protein [Verrucomicrobiota bacterium]